MNPAPVDRSCLFLLVALGLIPHRGIAQTIPPVELVTVGSAQLRLPPDGALVTIGIESRGRTAAMAAGANVRPVKRVRDTLGTIGFPHDSVRVTGYEVQPNQDDQHADKIIDYGASTTLEIRLRALSRLGEVFDAVLGAGATSISRVQFESDTLEAARRHALGMALARSRADANALAAAAGGRLGRLLGITNTGMDYSSYRLDEMVVRGAAASSLYGGGAPIVTRDVLVSVAIQARWEFLP
jgi:uncharacterized protein YggE